MEYSRSQCVRALGISMDTLRYYENKELLKSSKGEGNRRIYDEQQIMRLLEFRKLKGLGFDNAVLFDMFCGQKSSDYQRQFKIILESLQDRRNEAEREMEYISELHNIYIQIFREMDQIRIGPLPEREFLLLEQNQEEMICRAMKGLPYLNYGYWIQRESLNGNRMNKYFSVDIAPLKKYRPELYEKLCREAVILSNGSGMKVYTYRFYSQLNDLTAEDFAPLLAYAQKHNYEAYGDVFGGIIGSNGCTIAGTEGYILTLTMEIRETDGLPGV